MSHVAGDNGVDARGNSDFDERKISWIRKRQGHRGADDLLRIAQYGEGLPHVGYVEREFRAREDARCR